MHQVVPSVCVCRLAASGELDEGGTGGSDGLGAVSITRLQALVKARSGEVRALQASIASLEADKLSLTNELVSLTTRNAQL